jgi:hypothetical protein
LVKEIIMPESVIYSGQGIAKDCMVGDRLMNRYAIFNGLEKPRRIDKNLTVTQLDMGTPTIISATSVATAGNLVNGLWYSYKAMYASAKYLRPVAVLDATGSYTRGLPSAVSSIQAAFALGSGSVVVSPSTNAAITTIFLYRSTGATTQAEAEAGPFYYVGQAANAAGNVTITDGLADSSMGIAVETDNYPPNAYRYAVCAFGYIFAGGNYPLGSSYTCTLTLGSPTVTANAGLFFDGIVGWTFKAVDDTSGGVDGAGLFYANYVNNNTLTLVNASAASMNYDGTSAGAGKDFMVYLPGNVLRWSKYGEPESWPLTNSIQFEGDITGIAQVPNTSMLLVFTDTPSIWALDLTLVGTASFKTTKRMISSIHTTSSHYSLCPVEMKLRGIDMHRKCIIETDGVSVVDITSSVIPKIWSHLSNSENSTKNWHAAYDPGTHFFGAFVTFVNSHRMVDFCIGQNVTTKSWFFNFEKDLLCTGQYIDPSTGEVMILGGTQGISGQGGAVWGRIWAPGTWSDWFPGGLRSGTILSSTGTVITVDNTTENLYTTGGGLGGRWVLVTDEDGESPQLAYILSNTANTITIHSVVNSVDSANLNPIPVAGAKFYVGVIEMRWGPKYFDFGDPDNNKKILEVLVSMQDYNRSDLPFIRVYRGLEVGFTYHRNFVESTYRDPTVNNENLYSRYESHVEECPRWGVCVVDRTYDGTTLNSLTIVFRRIGGKNEPQ